MSSSPNPETLKWVERGASGLIIGFLLAAPEYAGVNGVWWLQVPILGAVAVAMRLVWSTELLGSNRTRHVLVTVLLVVGFGAWDGVIVHARLAAERGRAVPVEKTGSEAVGTTPKQSGSGLNGSKPEETGSAQPSLSIAGRCSGRVDCGWRHDDLRWTITAEAANLWSVTEFFHTGALGITNAQAITYQAHWRGDTLHLVADKNHGSYEIDLTESPDQQTLSGHYFLHGSCDDVVLRRDND